MPPHEPAAPASPPSLREALRAAELTDAALFSATSDPVALASLRAGSSLGGRLPELAGKSVLLVTATQLPAALALIELDGLARRITICPPDLAREHLPAVIAGAEVDAIVSDGDPERHADLAVPLHVRIQEQVTPTDAVPAAARGTEWVLMTSGTTGVPKLVIHTLAGLTGAIKPRQPGEAPLVWGTFYDMRRYGGLQIFLRAVLGGASLVLSHAGEPLVDHLARLHACGVTHMSGTPTHWRRLVMGSATHPFAPAYVRLSGEIADQAILDSLRTLYPHARIAHAYASTEAGVAFAVEDGREGLPASMIGAEGEVELKVEADTLRIRSCRTAVRYVGSEGTPLGDADGFVDTGDIVERRGDRYHFVGRRGGIINVGGLKVHPEEVEAIINRHPQVRMSLVHARKNPITGAIVVADVVLQGETPPHADPRAAALKQEIMQACQERLPQHKVPAAIRFVPALDVATSGKLARRYA